MFLEHNSLSCALVVHFLGAFAKLQRATISFVMSVRLSVWNNWAPTGRLFATFGILVFLENLFRKFKFHWNLTRITATLHEDQCTFMIISRWILLRMRNVSDKSCRENQNTRFIFNNFFFPLKSYRLWYKVEKYGTSRQATDGNIIRRMRCACWITKATDTQS